MSASVFLDAFVLMRRSFSFDFYFYYIIYILVILKYIFKQGDLKILPKWFFITITILIGISYFTGIIYDTLGFSMNKQIIGILFSAIAFYCYFKLNDFQLWKIIKSYLYLSVVVAALGIFDEVLHLSGIHLTPIKGEKSLMFYRVYSIMGEPYFLAVILLPAFYYYFSQLFSKKMVRSIKNLIPLAIVFTCLVLTFSASGFLGMTFALLLLLYQKGFFSFEKGRIVLLPILLFALFIIALFSQEKVKNIQIRINDTFEAFTTHNLDHEFVKDLNSSTFALFTNYIIAEQSFIRNPISGSGLGSHVINYDRMFNDFFSEEFLITFGEFNKQDANSLFLRLMSETGLIGLVLFFIFLFKNFLKRKWSKVPELLPLVLINHGILIMIIIRLMRTGNYIGNGFFFFFLLYWATSKVVRNYKKYGKIFTLDGKKPMLD